MNRYGKDARIVRDALRESGHDKPYDWVLNKVRAYWKAAERAVQPGLGWRERTLLRLCDVLEGELDANK